MRASYMYICETTLTQFIHDSIAVLSENCFIDVRIFISIHNLQQNNYYAKIY